MSEIRFPVGSPLIIPSEVPKTGNKAGKNPAASFDNLLSNEMNGREVRFSAHADMRLKERGLDLTGADMARIKGAMDTLASKGGRDSLLLMGDTALIVNIPNRTVVTAMDAGSVFTNIDSAVIIGNS